MSSLRSSASARGSRTPQGRRPDRRRTRARRQGRRRLLALLGLVALVILAITIGLFGSGSSSGPRRSGSDPAVRAGSSRSSSPPVRPAQIPAPPPPPSAYRVGLSTMTILEPTTASAATSHTASGQPVRALLTRVRYPAVGAPGGAAVAGATPDVRHGPFPLVIFSQGFNYPAEGYSLLLDAWARAGYVVADPTYPLTDPGAGAEVNEEDIHHHPADLRYVISRLLQAGRASGGRLRGLINPSAIAVVGQSDGGDTSLAVAANSCCRDPRVRAAAILSGAELPAFGGSYFTTGAPPLLVVQGDMDTINAPGCSAALYNAAPAPKYYMDLVGAPHLTPYVAPGPWESHVVRAVTAFFDFYLKHHAAALGRLRRVAQSPQVASLSTAPTLTGASTYCPPTGIR